MRLLMHALTFCPGSPGSPGNPGIGYYGSWGRERSNQLQVHIRTTSLMYTSTIFFRLLVTQMEYI